MGKCKSKTRFIPAAVAWIVLLLGTGSFFYYPCAYLQEEYHIFVTILQGLIAFFVISNLFLATFMDPGIIPKARADEDTEDDFRAPLYKSVEINGISVRMKWCVTCQFYRPPRCSHCSVCNNCIETFDHHCPWVNNCIGRRNYRHFFLFLVFLSIHMISVLIWCIIFVHRRRNSLDNTDAVVTFVLIGLITVLFIPIIGLTGFHCYLTGRGRTTNEQVTGKFKINANPYTRGSVWANLVHTLCASPSPSYIAQKNIQSPPLVALDEVNVYKDSQPIYHGRDTKSASSGTVIYTGGLHGPPVGRLATTSGGREADYRVTRPLHTGPSNSTSTDFGGRSAAVGQKTSPHSASTQYYPVSHLPHTASGHGYQSSSPHSHAILTSSSSINNSRPPTYHAAQVAVAAATSSSHSMMPLSSSVANGVQTTSPAVGSGFGSRTAPNRSSISSIHSDRAPSPSQFQNGVKKGATHSTSFESPHHHTHSHQPAHHTHHSHHGTHHHASSCQGSTTDLHPRDPISTSSDPSEERNNAQQRSASRNAKSNSRTTYCQTNNRYSSSIARGGNSNNASSNNNKLPLSDGEGQNTANANVAAGAVSTQTPGGPGPGASSTASQSVLISYSPDHVNSPYEITV